MAPPVIIGSDEDPHVHAVVEALRGQAAVIDVARLQDSATFQFAPPEILIETDSATLRVQPGCRGWIRRVSPMAWEAGTTIGSHEAAVKASWLSLLAAILRHPDIAWLSDIDAMTAAENKLTQYTTAARLGISVPRTTVSNIPSVAPVVGGELIAKPLGPGHFQDEDGRWLTVFTGAFDPTDPNDRRLLAGPPFIVQERVQATAHLRIATVRDHAWIFRRPAEDLPLDWREVEAGHLGWQQVRDEGVGALAVQLAEARGLGYSSQDWIEHGDDRSFIDLNPGGQWLFLPDPGAEEITLSIAQWLAERCE